MGIVTGYYRVPRLLTRSVGNDRDERRRRPVSEADATRRQPGSSPVSGIPATLPHGKSSKAQSRRHGSTSAILLGRDACTHPARTLSFLLPVIGDAVDVIASGPTAPDPTTYDEAWAVLERHRLLPEVPDAVRALLNRGRSGELPETPKPGDPVFSRVENRIVGSNRLALAAAARRAESLGYAVRILSAELAGEVVEVGKRCGGRPAGENRLKAPTVAGGETTVTVRGTGRGGRNQELALAFAMEIAGVEGITMLSAGTDGTDGPTDAAGARVDGRTVIRAERRGLAAGDHLARNDSHTFFERLGERFVTGPTGTNVMDIQVILIG